MTHPKTSRHQHSPATKNWLVGAVEAGESVSKAATRFGLSNSTARDIVKKFQRKRNIENEQCSGHPPSLLTQTNATLFELQGNSAVLPLQSSATNLGLMSPTQPSETSSRVQDTTVA
jgi:transposase-like protein